MAKITVQNTQITVVSIDERDYISDTFAPQNYGVATKKGSALSAKIEELIVKWKGDGTIDKLIAQFGLN